MASKPRATTQASKRPALKKHESSFDLLKGKSGNAASTPKPHQLSKKPNQDKSRTAAAEVKRDAATKVELAKKSKGKELFDQEAEQKFERMIEGQLDNIPNIPRSVVRIFISSTFSDMRAERNAIVREATPKLRDFCAEHDLDFQMVDMRWGVTDDSQNDHSVEKICLMEVENCQKISLGPNFVLIKGTRYGFRPIPIEISTKDYDLLTNYITNPDHTKLLQTWYLKDDNSKPPQYVLQNIRSQYKFFGDYSPGCEEPRAKDTENWHQTFQQLQLILRGAAKAAAKAGKMPDESLHQYFQSVTEAEIEQGILNVKDPRPQAVVYVRSLEGLDKESLVNKNATRYIDIQNKNDKLEVDKEIESLREQLLKKIKKKLKGTNCREYGIPWISGGIDPNLNQDHAQYIEWFLNDFLSDIKVLIEDGLTDYLPNIRWSEWYTDYADLIHHLQFCNTKCETFCGQTDVLDSVKAYILTDTSRKPFVLHAPSGAGKTSVMAMIMKNLSSWFKKQKHVAVIRFLGTSPLSTNIYDVLRSVCGQLADHAEIIMEPASYKTMKNLLEYVPRFFRRVANTIKLPIVILLDSLDQLTANNDAYSLAWLPLTLLSNVKLIVSTLPLEHGILDTLRDLLPNDKSYVEVPSLSMTTGKEIINKYLSKRKRTVTDNQLKRLLSSFTHTPGPLYLKLLLDEAVKWKSYTPEHELVLADTVRSAISQLFQTLEVKFGEVFTNHALGYITIAMNGVSETEMEDVLSCDDEVINDVYRYHDPPVPGIVRIPPVLWARLRYDLKEYLVERRAHNKYTLNWYHRQFIEAGRTMYTQGKAGQKLHRNFSEIFMSQAVKRTIKLEWRKTSIENADRQINPQAMVSKNMRMLSCLPYYIHNAKEMISLNQAKKKCFCNFHFIKEKLAAFPLSALQEDLTAFVDRTEDEEVRKLRYFFTLCKLEDLNNAEKIAVSLLSKLSCTVGENNLLALLDVALEYLKSQNKPLLIPKYACMAPGADSTSAMKDSVRDCENVLSNGGDSILLRLCGKESDKDNKCLHTVYNTVTEEQQQVSLPCTFSDGLTPRLDRNSKNIYYINNGQIDTVNLFRKITMSKKLSEVCPQLSANAMPVMSAFDMECSFVTILFDDSSLIMIDLASMKVLRLLSLSEKAANIVNLVCTGWDSSAVIVSGKCRENEEYENSGFVRIVPTSGEKNDRVIEIPTSFSDGQICLASSDEFLVGLCNTNMSCTLIALQINNLDKVCQMSFPEVMIQVSVSRNQFLAAVLSQKGVVSLLNWKEEKILNELSTNNLVSCLYVNWSHRLAVIGDSEGQIMLHDIRSNNYCGTFFAHQSGIQRLSGSDDQIISLGHNHELKIWSIPALTRNINESNNDAVVLGLLGQTQVASLGITLDSLELLTASRDKRVSVWSLTDISVIRSYDISMVGDKIQVISKDSCVALDNSDSKIKVFKLKNGDSAVDCDLPKGALDFTVSQDRSLMCILCQTEKGHMVDVMDLKAGQSKKVFFLRGVPEYETIDVSLSANSRYILLRSKVTEEYFKTVEENWKKEEAFFAKPRRYRFSAADITQATGGVVHCLRSVTKFPQLGEVMTAFQGNVVMITTRRWILFWDLPTGRCDNKVSKVERKRVMQRPDWLGQDSSNTPLALAQSINGMYVAIGLHDGYLLIYSVNSGLPVTKEFSRSKHTTSVVRTIFSPNSEWVASACRNNTIKIWEASTGKEVFSTKANLEIVQMCFSANSETLVVSIGSQVTRILVYTVHTGCWPLS